MQWLAVGTEDSGDTSGVLERVKDYQDKTRRIYPVGIDRDKAGMEADSDQRV